MNTTARGIGRVGTVSRVAVGLALLYLATTVVPEPSWKLTWYDAVIGLIGLPAVMIAAGLAARRFAGRDIHFTGPAGVVVNLTVILALATNRYTSGGAGLFYGITLLAAAWRGQRGCEATVLSNLILRRDDQIGCPAFSPIDALEARRGGQCRQPPTAPRHAGPDRPGPAPHRKAAPMITDQKQTAGRPGGNREGRFWRNPLVHLGACLAITALVILLNVAIQNHWLT